MRIKLSDHFDYRRLLRYAASAICMMVFTSIYGMVDGFFVSNYCGKTPFAALNIIYPVIMVISTIGFMLGTGGSAVVARTMGEGRNDDAKHYFSMFVYLDIAIGVFLVTLAQLFLPQMILSLLGVMDSIPQDLTEAAGSLGATRLVAFLRVVFPLSVSGLVTGAVLVFTGCMTAYTTPQLLGATDTQVLSTMVYQYAMSLRDWAQASAVAMVMILVTMLVSGVFNRLSRKINPMAA